MENNNVIQLKTFGSVKLKSDEPETEVVDGEFKRVITTVDFKDEKRKKRVLTNIKSNSERCTTKWPKDNGSTLTDYDVNILKMLGYDNLYNLYLETDWFTNIGDRLNAMGYDLTTLINLTDTFHISHLEYKLDFINGTSGIIRKREQRYSFYLNENLISEFETTNLDGVFTLNLVANSYIAGLINGGVK